MGQQDDRKTVTRRDVLKLAGTAAAFCASFGFLHADQAGRVVQDKHAQEGKHLQARWQQAEIKFYKGNELLHSSAVPAKVMKYLQSDEAATIELKLFRMGKMHKIVGTIEAKF